MSIKPCKFHLKISPIVQHLNRKRKSSKLELSIYTCATMLEKINKITQKRLDRKVAGGGVRMGPVKPIGAADGPWHRSHSCPGTQCSSQ